MECIPIEGGQDGQERNYNGFQDGGRILIAPEKKTVVLKEK